MNRSPVGATQLRSVEDARRSAGLMRTLVVGGVLVGAFFLSGAFAQQLDVDPAAHAAKPAQNHPGNYPVARPVERYVPSGSIPQLPEENLSPASPGSANNASVEQAPVTGGMSYGGGTPLTATVTHTLYLPPAMYGQWNVTGTLMETNAPDLFSPTVNDIWLLEREGNQVTVTNPVNGASATISVDRAEGDRATFHRTGTAGRHSIFQETPTITVSGDRFSGQSFNRVQNIRNGQVTKELYGIYHLEATRISAARTRFRPEAEQQDPDLQIEEVH